MATDDDITARTLLISSVSTFTLILWQHSAIPGARCPEGWQDTESSATASGADADASVSVLESHDKAVG